MMIGRTTLIIPENQDEEQDEDEDDDNGESGALKAHLALMQHGEGSESDDDSLKESTSLIDEE